jgi:hypothetical protein
VAAEVDCVTESAAARVPVGDLSGNISSASAAVEVA